MLASSALQSYNDRVAKSGLTYNGKYPGKVFALCPNLWDRRIGVRTICSQRVRIALKIDAENHDFANWYPSP